MHTNPTDPATGRVDPDELDRHITEMYRDVANEAGRDLHFPTGRPLAEALGYPAELLDRLPAQAVSSFAGVGYHLGLARLLPGDRVLDLGSGSGMDVFAAAALVVPGGSVTGVDITPEQLAKSEHLRRDGHVSFLRGRIEEIAAPTACQADLWAACIAGASQADLYLKDIAAAGLEPQLVQDNPGYRFASERAQRTSRKYGAHSISLLALKPVRASRHVPGPDLGGGADAAQAPSRESHPSPTTTEEVSK
jgi:arsenite methyltransferase